MEHVFMKKVKLRWITIISFAVLFAVSLGFAFTAMTTRNAFAATKEYEPTAIFAQGVGGSVAAYKAAEGGETDAYTTLKLKDDGEVYYRRNLALKWFDDAAEQNFNLQFRFVEAKFETFTMTFESAEENITKEGKTQNALIFRKGESGIVAVVKNSAGEESATVPVNANVWLTLSLSEGDRIGEFDVALAEGDETAVEIGTFTNIGGYFLEYRSSAATTPQTPVTFAAQIADPAAGEQAAEQKVLLRSLNGQSLVIKGNDLTASDAEDDGYCAVTGGKVIDDTAPAIVLNKKVYAFKMGQRFSTSTVNYQVIDVCDNNATAKLYYYMLKKNEDGEYVKGETTDYRDITASRPAYFMPTGEIGEDEMIYVSVRFDLKGNHGVEDSEYVYLSWYAVEDALVTLPATGDNAFDYIKVDRDNAGPQYVGLTAGNGSNEFSDESAYNAAVEAYQNAVTEAAKNVSAGSGSNFYLPSLRGLITSDYADYRDLKFSVYFHKPSHSEGESASSATSLTYNSLKFEIGEQGYYTFRILATDAASNNMQYYLDGNLVTLNSSNIWEIDEIPEFRFYVGYTGATIEDSGEQKLGYRDTVYSIEDFEVIALDGIQKEYALYYFDETKLAEGESAPTYEDFVKNIDEYVEKYANCLKEINEYDSDVAEDDEDWEKTDNDYAWHKNNSLSFNPQVSGFYLVKLTVTDPNRSNEVKTAYKVMEVQNPFDYTPGQSQWLQNNVVSIVLFAISAVLLVIVIALFVVKPSDKKVEEVDLQKLKGRKKLK